MLLLSGVSVQAQFTTGGYTVGNNNQNGSPGWLSGPLCPPSNITSQTFPNWESSGIDVTYSYSTNGWDGDAPNKYVAPGNQGLEGPGCDDQFTVGINDAHCATFYHGAARITNNIADVGGPAGSATGPHTFTSTYSQNAIISNFRIGSISNLGSVADPSPEWVHVEAYDDANNKMTINLANVTVSYIDCSNIITPGGGNIITDGTGGFYGSVQNFVRQGPGLYGNIEFSIAQPVKRIVINFWRNDSSTDPLETAGRDKNGSYTIHQNMISLACTTPTATAAATQPTCVGVGAPNNGTITINGFTAGQRYQYSSGATFNSGAAIPASITAIPVGGVITSTLPNTTQQYTVRIYDATDDACYVDRVVSITAVACCTVTINSSTPSVCDPATNKYSLAVNVSWTNASGTTLTVSVPGGSATLAVTAGSNGTNQVVTITGLTADGTQDIDVTAQFDAGCTATTLDAYDAPANCCPPPYYFCAALGDDFDLTAQTGLTGYQWYLNGNPISGANAALYNTNIAGVYTWTALDGGNCPIGGCCPITLVENCTCVNPTHNAPTTAAGTCTGASSNNDATITITGVANADKIGISTGATYSGTPAYAAATLLSGATMYMFSGLMHNTQYTIRIFNGGDACFTDVTITTASIACCTVAINSSTASACVPATNTYSLTVNVSWTGASGTSLTVTTTAPGATPQTITTTLGSSGTQSVTFTGLTANATMYNVTAQFGAGCTATTTNAFTAPPACTGCPTGDCGSTNFLKRT